MYKKRSFRAAPARGNTRKSSGNRRSKQVIHESRFVNRETAAVDQPELVLSTAQFSDFALDPAIQQRLIAAGYLRPTAIQERTIPVALTGRDVIGLANTGTGKTAAFLLPILDRLVDTHRFESVLIMAPTRELAQQIDEEFKKFSAGMRLYSALCVGGVGIVPQLRALDRRPHVIIGTPGRIRDHINRGSLKLNNVEFFVLDEADRMLDMGFVAEIRRIAALLPAAKQTLCFSATFSDGIKAIAEDFMRSPELISVKVTETADHIYQDVVYYRDNEHRRDILLHLLGQDEFEKVIVFGETKYGVQRLSDHIDSQGISSRAIHGNKSQSQRNRALDEFKTNQARVLFATDVAARGLDIPNVSHVINYDTPQTYDDYVHRIGRTGRNGKSGTALTFVQKNL